MSFRNDDKDREKSNVESREPSRDEIQDENEISLGETPELQYKEKSTPPSRSWSTFFRTSSRSLGGIVLWTGIAAAVLTLFPIIGATVTAGGVVAIITAPALLLAGVFGYREYKAIKKLNKDEKEANTHYEAHLKDIKQQDMLKKLHENIAEMLKHLQGIKVVNEENEENEQQVLRTLQAIDAMRKVTRVADYGKDVGGKDHYEDLLKKYNRFVDEYNDDKSHQNKKKHHKSAVIAKPQPKGFFKELGSDIAKFFVGLNEKRKKVAHEKGGGGFWAQMRGVLEATGKFFNKGSKRVLPFLGGVSLGISLGMAGLGIALLFAGGGASLSGVGAIGGAPVAAIGGIIAAGGIVVGLTAATVDYFIKTKHERKVKQAKADEKTLDHFIVANNNLVVEVEKIKSQAMNADYRRILSSMNQTPNVSPSPSPSSSPVLSESAKERVARLEAKLEKAKKEASAALHRERRSMHNNGRDTVGKKAELEAEPLLTPSKGNGHK